MCLLSLNQAEVENARKTQKKSTVSSSTSSNYSSPEWLLDQESNGESGF